MADIATHTIKHSVGPFGGSIRPFTVNGALTKIYANVNDLLGFEIGDLQTLSRSTDWRETSPGIFVGLGQRLITTDVDDFGLMDIRSILLNAAEESIVAPASMSAAG